MPNRIAFRGIRISCVLLASSVIFSALAQGPGSFPPVPVEPSAPALQAPDQLENLVAPVALYPDQLLSQVLAASTYPLEIVEAQQWLGKNGYLRGPQLVDAAKQQNWDPSVQALVIFPDALALLSRDVQWTTALGNAFLAQQVDVMDAIQRLRARAQNNGRLRSTPQEIVTNPWQGGQWQPGDDPIEIRPADPRMIYVPSYNPQNIWGPPAQGAYPSIGYSSFAPQQGNYPQLGDSSFDPQQGYYPQGGDSSSGSSIGQFLGTAVNLASYFTGFGGLASGTGWGWALNWLTHSVLLNGSFLDMFGFHSGNSYGANSYGGGYGAPSVWVHDPGHRGGVPYSNSQVAGRFGGGYRTRNVAFTSGSGFGGGSYSGGHYDGGSRGNFGGGWRTPAGDRIGGQTFGGREAPWRSPSNTRAFSSSNFASANRGYSSPGYGAGAYGPGRGNGVNGFRGSQSPGWSSRNAPSLRASNQHFSESRSRERISAPRQSSHFSAPHFSAPRGSRSHGSGGHSSGGHSSKSHGSGGHSHKH
jgi:Protein of unknown function (DUF3300)